MPERKSIIAVSSVTYAMKGADILQKSGIRRRVTKIKPDKTKKGCTYGIAVDTSDTENAARLLKIGGVPYSEIING